MSSDLNILKSLVNNNSFNSYDIENIIEIDEFRNINLPESNPNRILIMGDSYSQVISFKIKKKLNSISLLNDIQNLSINIKVSPKANLQVGNTYTATNVIKNSNDDYIYFDWQLDPKVAGVKGEYYFCILFLGKITVDNEENNYIYTTKISSLKVEDTLLYNVKDAYNQNLYQIYLEQVNEKIAEEINLNLLPDLVGKKYKVDNELRGEIFNEYDYNEARKLYSSAFGSHTISNGESQFVCGQYNIIDTLEGAFPFIVGSGKSETERANAFTVDWNGNGWFKGDVKIGGISQDDINAVYLEKQSNKTTNISSESDNIEYPTAKAVYDRTYSRSESDNRYLPQDIANGTIVTTEFAIEDNAIDYKIYGNSIQDGTPTPTTPVEIESVGDLVTSGEHQGKYKVETKVVGKNLTPSPNATFPKTSNGVTVNYDVDTQIYTLNGTSTNLLDIMLYTNQQGFLKVYEGTTVVGKINEISGTRSSDFYVIMRPYDSYKVQFGASPASQTVTSNGNYTLGRLFIYAAKGTTFTDYKFKVQHEYGTTATEYEPYRESIITTYLDEPLRKIGDCADYIDYKNQKVIRNVGMKIFDGTETWILYNPNSSINQLYTNVTNVKTSLSMVRSLCNKYTSISITNRDGNYNTSYTATNNLAFNVQNFTVTTWKAQLATWNTTENPLKMYYVLTIPTEETISLEPIPLQGGTNNIITYTAVKPSNIEVTYYQNPTEVINELRSMMITLQSQTK